MSGRTESRFGGCAVARIAAEHPSDPHKRATHVYAPMSAADLGAGASSAARRSCSLLAGRADPSCVLSGQRAGLSTHAAVSRGSQRPRECLPLQTWNINLHDLLPVPGGTRPPRRSETQSVEGRDPNPRTAVFPFHRPETLAEWLAEPLCLTCSQMWTPFEPVSARRAKAGSHITPGSTSSARTLKLFRVFGPNVWLIETSAASRPRAISMRPMRGTLFLASKVYQWPPR